MSSDTDFTESGVEARLACLDFGKVEGRGSWGKGAEVAGMGDSNLVDESQVGRNLCDACTDRLLEVVAHGMANTSLNNSHCMMAQSTMSRPVPLKMLYRMLFV